MDSIALSIRSIARSASLRTRRSCLESRASRASSASSTPPGPAAGLAILNVAASGRRLVDRLAQTRCESLLVGAVGGRGDLQLAKQGRIALGKLDDHRDESSIRLIREVGTNARERAHATRLGAMIALIRGQRGRHHVLAEAVVVEGGTGALALDRLALAEEIDAVILRSGDLRQHSPGFDGEDLDAPVSMVGLAAGEGAAREPP